MPSLTAHVPVPADRMLAPLRERAEALGAEVTPLEDGARIRALSGTIEARRESGGLRVAVSSDDAEGLEMLRSAVQQFLAAAGLAAPLWQGAVKGAAAGRGRLSRGHVESITRISPSYTRMRLVGDFSAFREGGLHFRLLLGPRGAAFPQEDAGGSLVWPGGIDLWHRPPYTIRALDPGAGWLDVDIFRHRGGRITEWCDEIAPGEEVALTGPGGRGVRQAGWLGLVGDETALPVILRALEAAGPGTRGRAAIVIPDPGDAQAVALPPGLTLDWVVRGEGASPLELFTRLDPPAGERFVFFAGERRDAEAARDHARALGLEAGEFHAAAYWTEGWVPPSGQRQARG